ncbi:MAG: hypothetical protein ACRDHN_21130 [Thermomicrobiales bacterium]
MASELQGKAWLVSRLIGQICGALFLAGCVSRTIPSSLDQTSKRVAVISLVSEDVRVVRTSFMASAEVASLAMGGQIRKTIDGVFASQLAVQHPTWVIEPLSYDSDLRYSRLRAAATKKTFSLTGYDDGTIRAQVFEMMRAKKLDAVFLILETAYEGLETRYPGIGVTLVGVPAIPASNSGVTQLDVHCTLLVLVVDSQGNLVAMAANEGMYGAKTFDRSRERFSYNLTENLEPPRVEYMRAWVVQAVTENLKRQFAKLGV